MVLMVCIPAVVNNTDGSFSGINGADGITACPCLLKNSKYLFLISYCFHVKNLLFYYFSFYIMALFYYITHKKARFLAIIKTHIETPKISYIIWIKLEVTFLRIKIEC